MRMKKYLLSFMAIALATVANAADGDTFTYQGLNFTVISEAEHTAKVAENPDVSGSVSIPMYAEKGTFSYTVTEIGASAFSWCSNLTSVAFPNSVKTIGWFAFSGCSNLTSINLPRSVTEIGERAFSDCSGLKSVIIPAAVTEIGRSAFANCSNLTEILVEEGNSHFCSQNGALFNIDKTTLILCPALKTEFNIPSSVKIIGEGAFSGCSSLTSVTIPNSVTVIGEEAFSNCSGLSDIILPKSVTEIGAYAFSDCSSLTSVTIPESVSEISGAIFSGCSSLISVTIPKIVTKIGGAAFSGCSSLTSINIPPSVTEIGEDAFRSCSSMTSVSIPAKVIGRGAFSWCSGLTSVNLTNTVTVIGESAFFGCSSLTSLTIPASVNEIGLSAFNCENLKEILVDDDNSHYSSQDGVLFNKDKTTLIQYPADGKKEYAIPTSVREICGKAFLNCGKLTSVDIPNSVREIGESAFFNCKGLKTVSISASVKVIGVDVFSFCSNLTSIIIPVSVESIGERAFYLCDHLEAIYNLSPTPQVIEPYAFAFMSVPNNAVVYVPKGSASDYAKAEGWNQFTNFREMGAFDVTLSSNAEQLAIGETATITASITKDDDMTVTSESWVSCNPEVATVDDGKITAVSAGETEIWFTAVDGYGVPHAESCTVTVAGVPVESISLEPTVIAAVEGDVVKLTATVFPDNAANKEITWSSSDETVATVTANESGDTNECFVRVVKAGTCVITAAATDGSGIKAECQVDATSGIGDIFSDASELVNVYNLQGVEVLRHADAAKLHNLPAGIYIVRQGKSIKKISVK